MSDCKCECGECCRAEEAPTQRALFLLSPEEKEEFYKRFNDLCMESLRLQKEVADETDGDTRSQRGIGDKPDDQ